MVPIPGTGTSLAIVGYVIATPAATPAGKSAEPDPALLLDHAQRRAWIEGREILLTSQEFELLAFLAEHPRQVLTREQLFKHFWGEIGDRHTVTVHIGRIREKIEAQADAPRYITTVWGVGYRFEGVRR